MEVSDVHVGKQLQVNFTPQGIVPIPPLCYGFGPTAVPGTIAANGGVLVGSPLNFPIPNVPEAALMVGRPDPTVNQLASVAPSIFKVSNKGSLLPPTPVDVLIGDPGKGIVGVTVHSSTVSIFNATNVSIFSPKTFGIGALNWVGSKTFTGVVAETGAEARAGAEVVSAQTADNGLKTINGSLLVAGTITTPRILAEYGAFSAVAAPFKQFDIPHPTKPNHRLRHSCLEGPEIGVYYRGKLIDNNIIELPEYWRGLVDAETITVNLTPHGCYQELFVKKIEWGTRIIIQNNSGGPIDCSYVVYAKRKDVPDLKIEYYGNEMMGDM